LPNEINPLMLETLIFAADDGISPGKILAIIGWILCSL